MNQPQIDILSKKYPVACKTFESIYKIQKLIDKLELMPFKEPEAWYLLGKRPQPLILTADVMATWLYHVSYGTRVRLKSFEEAFISELVAGRFLTSMVIARSHMENAGLGAYSERLLVNNHLQSRWLLNFRTL